MSRIGKNAITLPPGVDVKIEGDLVTVSGPKGEGRRRLGGGITAALEDGRVLVSRSSDTKEMKAAHGLYRSLIANMVEGVTKGYRKRLEIIGVGYRARVEGGAVVLQLGFSHPVKLPFDAKQLTVEVEKNTLITISGADKETVGAFAARIREIFPPEPYKGKGIRYEGEYVKRKAGKTIA
jgi:large subunit ribosomal protein L6